MRSNPWKTIDSKIVYENQWVRLREDQVLRPDGSPGIYSVLVLPRSAGVIPFDPDGNICVVGQWRYVHGKFGWEIPTGSCSEADLDSAATARRELKEETGLTANALIFLGEIENSNGCTTDVAAMYAALCSKVHQALYDEIEIQELRWVPFSQAFEMVMSGEISESTSVAAILKMYVLLAGPFRCLKSGEEGDLRQRLAALFPGGGE